jgi:hypothetical protein
LKARLIGYGCLTTCFLWVSAVIGGSHVDSVYTKLAGTQCKYLERDAETGSSVRKCPGIGGYHLLVLEDDARMSVTVVSPDRVEHPLNFWEVVTPAFSHLGKNAEWRVIKLNKKLQPIALIVRVNTFYQEEITKPVIKPYLSVSKITPNEVCVTDVISNDKNANQKARDAANNAVNNGCIKP